MDEQTLKKQKAPSVLWRAFVAMWAGPLREVAIFTLIITVVGFVLLWLHMKTTGVNSLLYIGDGSLFWALPLLGFVGGSILLLILAILAVIGTLRLFVLWQRARRHSQLQAPGLMATSVGSGPVKSLSTVNVEVASSAQELPRLDERGSSSQAKSIYKIIGADHKEYGPATGEQMRQWIHEGRLNGATEIRSSDSRQWKLVREVPEFAALLRPPPTTQPPPLRTLPLRKRERSPKFNIIVGGLICGGGVLLTAMGQHAAEVGGGSYRIYWGAILFGGIQLLYGLYRFAEGSGGEKGPG